MAKNNRWSLRLVGGLFGFCLALGVGSPAYAFHFPWDQGHDTTDWNDPPPPGPCEGGECECDPGNCDSSSSPVNMATGHFFWTDKDIVLKGRPLLELSRTYNSHDPRDGVFGNGWSFTYDRSLLKVRQTDAQGEEHFFYIMRLVNGKRYSFTVEADGSITPPPGIFQRIEPQSDGTVRLVSLDGSYDVYAYGKLISVVDRNGNVINYQYDNQGILSKIADTNGRFLSLGYNSNGRIYSITDHAGRTWRYDYDVNGNLVSVTDPLNGVTSYQYQNYQPAGDGYVYYHLTRITDPTNVVLTQITYNGERVRTYTEGANTYTLTYDIINRVVTKIDSMGSQWRSKYDQNGLYIERTDPLNHTVFYQRNADGLVTKITDELGNQFNSMYDALGRLTSSSDVRGSIAYEYLGDLPLVTKIVSRTGRITQLTYDLNNNPTAVTDSANNVTQFEWNSNGDITTIENALQQKTNVTTNTIGLPIKVSDALGRSMTYVYDGRGNLELRTNAKGEITRYEYDLLDRVTRVVNALGHETQYSYDAASRVKSVTAQNNETISYDYDSFGRLSSRTNYDGGQHIFTYRADNLRAQLTEPSGVVTKYSYDAAKRITQMDAGGEITSYQYSARGELLQAINQNGTVKKTYDEVGRLLSESMNGQTIQYDYNGEDEITQLTGLGKTQSYQYNNRGLLSRISGATGQYDITYDSVGRRTHLIQPNGNSVSYQYDVAGQITQIDHTGLFNATYEYQYDDAGRMLSWTGDGAPKIYQYDNNGQLTRSVDDFGTTDYTYDPLGNNIDNGKIYDKANRLTQDSATTYSYDANGNLTLKQDKTTGARSVYTWDAKNQLIRVDTYTDDVSTSPVSVTSFTYGPLGRRWSKTVDGHAYKYIYSRNDRIGTLDDANSLVEYVSFSNVIDEPVGMEKGGKKYFFHSNHQGSVMALTDETRVQASYQYNAFGRTAVMGDDGLNDFRYTGREYDGEDLYYYRARYYDAGTSRFYSEDPIGYAGGLNLYSYIRNAPVLYRDPMGLLRDCDQEQIECFRNCWNTCPPWPIERGKRGHYLYCQSKCLAEYMECIAENAAESTAKFCSNNPGTCVAIVVAGVVIIFFPEAAPVLAF